MCNPDDTGKKRSELPSDVLERIPSEACAAEVELINARLAAIYGDASALEANHGNHRARPIGTWGFTLIGSAAAVARIDFLDGASNGTGFLVWARGLGIELDEYVLVTCNHVVNDPSIAGATAFLKDSKHPSRMRVRFELRRPYKTYRCEVLWQSPINQLDIAVLRLNPRPKHTPKHDFERSGLTLASSEPEEWLSLPSGGRRRQRLFLLHHPGGAPLSTSIEDNEHMGLKARPETEYPLFLHYRCPTEPGSSGCPILNENLEVVAVQRAGSETLHDGVRPAMPISRVNEGVSIQSVRRELFGARVVVKKRGILRKLLGWVVANFLWELTQWRLAP